MQFAGNSWTLDFRKEGFFLHIQNVKQHNPVAVWSATQTASTQSNSNSFPISSTHTKVLFSSGCQNF